MLVFSIFMGLMALSSRVNSSEYNVEKEIEALKSRVHQLEETKGETSSAQLSLHGIMAGNIQSVSAQQTLVPSVNESRGTFIFQPEVSVVPSQYDEFFFKFGFAGGNGLDEVSPFALSLWATDMEEGTANINGRKRDYLLTSWYKHVFTLGTSRLECTGGIVDATEYIGENEYSGDPFSQFMNGALVTGEHVFTPSYDLGGAMVFQGGPLSMNGVVMSVKENGDRNSFIYYGFQLGAKTQTSFGQGNLRAAVSSTNRKFMDVNGTTLEKRFGVLVSCDQELGERAGAWVRFGVQDDKAAIDYRNLYSGGINIRGNLWGRPRDEVGIGHGMLDGGNGEIHQSDVTEAYLRLGLNEWISLTCDVQRLRDTYNPEGERRVEGWVSGVRITAGF